MTPFSLCVVFLTLPTQDAAQGTAQDAPLLTLWVEDAATCLSDPKDAALVAALRLVDDRVLELQGEIPGFPALPPEAVRLAAHLLTGRKSLRVLASDDPNLALPVIAQLELVEADPEHATALADSILALGRSFGAPLGEAGADGFVPIEVPGEVPVRFGARGGRVLLSVGKTIAEPGTPANPGLPRGVKPSLSMHLDIGRLVDLAAGMMMMGSPSDAEEMTRMSEAFGLHDMRVDFAVGSDAERSYAVTRMPGYAATMRSMGLAPARSLTSADLGLVPGDAVWASVGTFNAQGTLEMILGLVQEEMANQGMEDPVETIAAMTGFHVQRDLIDNLGSVYAFYASDTTGGGGLASIAGFVELANVEGMTATLDRLAAIVDGFGQSEANGYVRMRTWEHAGMQMRSLVFPGFPAPVEPTIAVTGKHLLIAVTPQGAVAAAETMAAGGRGLLGNDRFTSELPSAVDGAYAVSFLDAIRLVRDGYGLTGMLCSAVANGTRSKHTAEREPGMILPTYHQLVKGVRATVGVTRVVGDDFVSETRSDRSLLVNVSSTLGLIGSTPLMLILPAALMGSLTMARMEAGQAAEWEYIEVEEPFEDPDEGGGDDDDDGGDF